MIQKFKKTFASLLVLFAILAPAIAAPAMAAAVTGTGTGTCPTSGSSVDIHSCLTEGACLSTNTATCTASSDPNGSINKLLSTIINIFSLVVGVIAVIMIIIGGIRFVLSGGDSSNVSAARNSILYAIVGLVVVALAQIIVHFVLARVGS